MWSVVVDGDAASSPFDPIMHPSFEPYMYRTNIQHRSGRDPIRHFSLYSSKKIQRVKIPVILDIPVFVMVFGLGSYRGRDDHV